MSRASAPVRAPCSVFAILWLETLSVLLWPLNLTCRCRRRCVAGAMPDYHQPLRGAAAVRVKVALLPRVFCLVHPGCAACLPARPHSCAGSILPAQALVLKRALHANLFHRMCPALTRGRQRAHFGQQPLCCRRPAHAVKGPRACIRGAILFLYICACMCVDVGLCRLTPEPDAIAY
jgi:hypothetical protein